MARFDRLTVYQALISDGMLPLFYHPDSTLVRQVAGALAAGGSRVIEFTNRGDFAVEVFADLVKTSAVQYPDMIVGVGTVEDAPTAAMYIAHGANFIVAPNFNPDVARLCNRRKIPYIPGVGTVTEIALAEEYGSEIVKMFPADTLGGPDFVKAVLGPRPWTRIMPSGGVSPDETNLRAWFKAGVSCVGMGSKLIQAQMLKTGDFAPLTELTRETLALIRTIRASK